MGFARTVTGLISLTSGLYYLTSASSLPDNGKWTLIGVTFVFSMLWVLMGSGKNTTSHVAKSFAQEVFGEDVASVEEEIDSDIPQPVKEYSLDGASLK